MYDFTCLRCGKKFQAVSLLRKYCPDCRIKIYKHGQKKTERFD